jgi:hypothetical protein
MLSPAVICGDGESECDRFLYQGCFTVRMDRSREMETTDSIWGLFAGPIESHLKDDDDPRLWHTVIRTIIPEAQFLCHRYRGKGGIFAQIGCCSHWMSPHNKGTWFSDARFAWPTGYGDSGFTIFGLPEFDWSVSWNWTKQISGWVEVEQIGGKRPLVFRVAVPARTARHVRAVVHTLWSPGSPTMPNKKLLDGYAFTRTNNDWRFISTSKLRHARDGAAYD